MNDALIKAVKSLLSDIEAMRSEGTYLFGSFSEYEQDYEDGDLRVDWPNLAISADNVKELLEGLTIEGELAARPLPSSDYATEYDGPLILSFTGSE